MRLSEIASDREAATGISPGEAMRLYEVRDRERIASWLEAFPLS